MKTAFSDLLLFRRDPLNAMLNCGNAAVTPLARLRIGLTPVWLVTDPGITKDVLKAPEAIIDKGRYVHKLRKVLGISSLSLSGEEHKRRREVLHSTFARSSVEKHAIQMAALIRATVAKLSREAEFDAHHATSRLTLRLVSLVMFGAGVLSSGDEQIIVDAVAMVEMDLADELFRVFPLSPWRTISRNRRRSYAKAAMAEVVQRIRSKAPKESAVGALEGLNLTDEEMQDEILTMILAGYHTTGNAAAWMLYHLALEDGLADQLRREAANLTDEFGEIIPEKLFSGSKSLAFVKEILRLYPSAHWFSRDAQQATNVGGIQLSAGDAILIAPWFFHRSKRFWKEPNKFDLNRDFASKAFVPFGFGPRACVGAGIAMLELQLIAIEFASACNLRVLSEVPASPPQPSITLVPPAIKMSLSVA